MEDILQLLLPVDRNAAVSSDWLTLDQERITAFGVVTNDPDPLHIDPVYAARFSPFGKTFAFGFLTMSLLTYFHHQVVGATTSGYALNYGFERVRLPNVVTVGSRLRGVFKYLTAEDRGEGKFLLRYDARIEIEGEPKPALVGEWLAMWVEDGIERPGHGAVPRAA
jgi:acyl dehydratase